METYFSATSPSFFATLPLREGSRQLRPVPLGAAAARGRARASHRYNSSTSCIRPSSRGRAEAPTRAPARCAPPPSAAPPPPRSTMHLMSNLLQASWRQSRSLAVVRKQAMARAASSGVDVRRLVRSRVRRREARMAASCDSLVTLQSGTGLDGLDLQYMIALPRALTDLTTAGTAARSPGIGSSGGASDERARSTTERAPGTCPCWRTSTVGRRPAIADDVAARQRCRRG